MLAKESFALALTSPLQRARETCRLAGFGDVANIEPDLVEWNYGSYEGLTPGQIHATAPGWLLFRDGGPGGEQPGEIGARVDRVIEKARAVKGNVILFAHGHVLRVFAARWLGLPASEGQRFLLDTATMNILSYLPRHSSGQAMERAGSVLSASAARASGRRDQGACYSNRHAATEKCEVVDARRHRVRKPWADDRQ